MIQFKKITLDNGLKVIIHQDKTTPIVAFNLLYDVGARDEEESRTGFAHLFEHLMFGGSKNIPIFDTPLQLAGGENNAFTSNDITNYYITVPKVNLETAFWLESDRMLELGFTDKSLEVQRQVVIEEFKQRYLNQPYGDVWLLLRPLVYKNHPYKWATIGKEIKHIEEATMDHVKAFFYQFYAPNNAVLCVSGDVTTEEVQSLAEKWFGEIPQRKINKRELPQEPKQNVARFLEVTRDVPVDAIYKVYRMVERGHEDYYVLDLISDILSRGKSSRFYQKLVKESGVFTEVSAFVTGDLDPGLFVVSGKISDGFTLEVANEKIEEVLEELKKGIEKHELQKVLNKLETTKVFSEISVLSKAMALCYFELMGDASAINRELEYYEKITTQEIKRIAKKYFQTTNCSTLFYKSNKT